MAKTGISRATLNNYIGLGLLSKPEIRSGEEGERLLGYFPESSIDRILEIKALKAQGLSMSQIVEELAVASLEGGAVEMPVARPFKSSTYSARARSESSDLFSTPPARSGRPASPGASFTPRSAQKATIAGGSVGLQLTLDEVTHPAYMFNYSFELVWYNEPARKELLGNFDRLPSDSEDRHVLPMLFKGLGMWPEVHQLDMVRANLGLAKSRLSKDVLLNTCRQLPIVLQTQIAQLYDEAPTSETGRAAATVLPVDLVSENGRSRPHRLVATYFREGIFVVCTPEEEPTGSLAEFLSRRDLVIRSLLKKRLPVVTPLAVLVADLQGSTRICSELPPEEYFELINEIWTSMEPIFRKYFATHGKHVGDGMVYYFFPQPDSHYVYNAVCCAEELKEEMRKISAAWQLRKGWFNELFLNIGLHEGTEWLGTFQTATSIEFAVLGDSINQAARLSDFARWGAIWGTKSLIGKLTAEEKSKLVYGVRRKNQDGREVFIESTFAQVEALVDVKGNEKLQDIAALPVTEIQRMR